MIRTIGLALLLTAGGAMRGFPKPAAAGRPMRRAIIASETAWHQGDAIMFEAEIPDTAR